MIVSGFYWLEIQNAFRITGLKSGVFGVLICRSERKSTPKVGGLEIEISLFLPNLYLVPSFTSSP